MKNPTSRNHFPDPPAGAPLAAACPELQSEIARALQKSQEDLLASRDSRAHWTGELSSSALSTATATCTLALFLKAAGTPLSAGARVPAQTADAPMPARCQGLIDAGLLWLAENVNPDGGWGDTTRSLSNISTTTLVWAAFGAASAGDRFPQIIKKAEAWLARAAGGLAPATLARALIERYGNDRTFSVPILTTCALSGRLGNSPSSWEQVLQLPFELAALPHQCFAAVRLPVVSYALPALIAIGQARHHHLPTRHPLIRAIRALTRQRTLDLLDRIQPSSGGFLEATPLTSFVTMSLISAGHGSRAAAQKGLNFLIASARPDGSWPIDTNLATWLTTLSLAALGPDAGKLLSMPDRARILDWLLLQQGEAEHPYTHAAPGGWAWTDLPGGVPDADDTAGALLALHELDPTSASVSTAAAAGARWLIGLQNKDGGIPTFCRGWGKLAFDRSSPDLTAHALRAWLTWFPHFPPALQNRLTRAIRRARNFLARTQQTDGSWLPLWFGNQFHPREENPVYGTSRVLLALQALAERQLSVETSLPIEKGIRFLMSLQRPEGGWSSSANGPVSVEETACALEGLAAAASAARRPGDAPCPQLDDCLTKGARYLISRVDDGSWTEPSPVGFYFAKLWYYEKLYPKIFTVSALSRLACWA